MKTKLFHLLAFCSLLIAPVYAQAAPSIAASIKPVHSLVSSVTQGITEPGLLMPSQADPHHASLKPSQRKLIADAALVVWVGPELETALAKPLAQSKATSLGLLKSGLPEVHKARGNDGNDPHIWLSPANAMHIAKVVTESLVVLDPDNKAQYEKNRDRLLSRIDSLAAEMEFELSLPNRSYIGHHDAYQYFEKSFGLDGAGFLRNSHNEDSGFSTVSKLSHMIELRTANCIVYDSSEVPGIITSLGKTDMTRYARIPSQGLEFNAGPDLWFDVMKKMSRRFRQCLQ